MTLGEKIRSLRKENDYSQEDLAEILDVSRQAVSKWESDKGIPELDKLVQISNTFGVTLDYLIKNDIGDKDLESDKFYVSEEMAKGYLSYKKKSALLIALGVALVIWANMVRSIILSNHLKWDFVYNKYINLNSIQMIIYFIIIGFAIALMAWRALKPNKYKEFSNRRLVFDSLLLKDLKLMEEKNRKKYMIIIISGILLLLLSQFIDDIFDVANNHGYYYQDLIEAFSWFLAGTSFAFLIYSTINMFAERRLAWNNKYEIKTKRNKRYDWLIIVLIVACIPFLMGLFVIPGILPITLLLIYFYIGLRN